MKRFLVLVLLLSCTLAFSQKKNQPNSDPRNPTNHWTGTYKLDPAQSKISGQPPAQETVVVTSASKDSVKYTIQGKDAQGNSYTMNYEGKVGTAAPQMAEGKEIAQITYQMPSPNQFTSQGRGSDGSSSTGTITLAKDNKTITVQEHSKDPKGAEHDQTMVYVRQ
jgi:opacity protein-like surface antigen